VAPIAERTLDVGNSPEPLLEDFLAEGVDFTKNLRFEPRPLGSQREAANA
jgi:hypothetical protein